MHVGVCGCARVQAAAGVRGCLWVYVCMHRGAQCGQVCVSVRWCVFRNSWVSASVCVCGMNSQKYLLENRVPTSADFNTYPIRIFCFILANN